MGFIVSIKKKFISQDKNPREVHHIVMLPIPLVKKILIFSVIFIFLLSTSLAQDDSFTSIIFNFTPLIPHDFNDHMNSLNNMFDHIYESFPPIDPLEKSFESRRTRRGLSFESDVRLKLVRGIDIGIIFTYSYRRRIIEPTITAGNYGILGDVNFRMHIYNPNLVLFYYIPFTKVFLVELYGGIGYYYVRVPFKHSLSYNHPNLFGQSDYVYQQTFDTTLNSHGWGPLAGATLEIRPFRVLGFLFGIRYRYVEMGRLSGSGTFRDTYTPETTIDKGVLYYYYDQDLQSEFGELFPLLLFAADEPVGLVGLREARLDLSGFVFIVGLRLYF